MPTLTTLLKTYNEKYIWEALQKSKSAGAGPLAWVLGLVILGPFLAFPVLFTLIFLGFGAYALGQAFLAGNLPWFVPVFMFGMFFLTLAPYWLPVISLVYIKNFLLQNASLRRRNSQAKQFLQTEVLSFFFRGFLENIRPLELQTAILEARVAHQYVYLALDRMCQYSAATRQIQPYRIFGRNKFAAIIEDALGFEYQNRPCRFAEVKVERRGFFRYRSLYNWLVVQVPVDHGFEGETVVYTKDLTQTYTQDLTLDTYESPEFAKYFQVHTSNPREARVCLKTNVIAALSDFHARNPRPMWLEFRDQVVLIGIDYPAGIFEAKPGRTLTRSDLQESGQTLRAMLEITDLLNINHEYLYKH